MQMGLLRNDINICKHMDVGPASYKKRGCAVQFMAHPQRVGFIYMHY